MVADGGGGLLPEYFSAGVRAETGFVTEVSHLGDNLAGFAAMH